MDLFIGTAFLTALGLSLSVSFWWMLVISAIVLIAILASAAEDAADTGLIWLLVIPILLVPVIWGVNPFYWVLQNPGLFVSNFLQYLLIGSAYALFRWVWLSAESGKAIKSKYDFWQKEYIASSFPDLNRTFEDFLRNHDLIPTASKNKNRIANWIVWWPFNAIGFLLSDFLRNFMRFFSNLIQHLFGNILTVLQRRVYAWIGLTDLDKVHDRNSENK